MTETEHCTPELRFVRKKVRINFNPETFEWKNVLQQKWSIEFYPSESPFGKADFKYEWRDVEIVDGEIK